MQRIMYPKLLRMFQEHSPSTSIIQRTPLTYDESQRQANNKESATLTQDHRRPVQHDPSPAQYVRSQPQQHYSNP